MAKTTLEFFLDAIRCTPYFRRGLELNILELHTPYSDTVRTMQQAVGDLA